VTQVPRVALSAGRGGIGGRATERVRQSLVVVQLAFALVLLVTAGALGQRLWTLVRAEPGFSTSGVTVATLTFTAASSQDYQRIAAQVRDVHAAGGRLVVAPNFDAEVVRAAVQLGMVCLPGVATITEAFAALAAGASALKLFPAEMLTPPVVKAWRAVLAPDTVLLPVGGITPAGMAAYRAAGANGFGLGSALYKPGQDAATVGAQARAFIAAWGR